MSYVKYSQTSTFLFPLIDVPKQLFNCDVKSSFGRLIMTTRFLNSYMWDENLEFEFNYGPYIFVVIKPYRDSNFEEFYSTIISMPSYVDEYEKEEHIVMIFKILEENMEYYNLILDGKYSKLPAEAKKIILKNNYFKLEPSLIPRILNKNADLRKSWEKALSNYHENPRLDSTVYLGDQEVWSIILRENEGLTSKKLKELGKTKKLSPEEEFDNK
tara:strand:+ start:12188 stop:12832 length:645 start_codon:yes stop_codon:yes gene_type:complete